MLRKAILVTAITCFTIGCGVASLQTYPVSVTKDPKNQNAIGLFEWQIKNEGARNNVSNALKQLFANHQLNGLKFVKLSEQDAPGKIQITEQDMQTSFEDIFFKDSTTCASYNKDYKCEYYYRVRCQSWNYSLSAQVQVLNKEKQILNEKITQTANREWCSNPITLNNSDKIILDHESVTLELASKLARIVNDDLLPFTKSENIPFFTFLGLKDADQNTRVQFAKGVSSFFKKDYKQSILDFNALSDDTRGKSWEVNYNLGVLHETIYEKQTAAKYYQKALTILGPTQNETKERKVEEAIRKRLL